MATRRSLDHLGIGRQFGAGVCNEGNRGLEHWVGKASDERRGEVQVAREILAKYVGTYEEQRPFWRAAARVVEITLSDGKLLADMDGRGKVPPDCLI